MQCMFHVPHLLARISRAIQHILSCLAGAQTTDWITCLAITHFAWVCTNHPNFVSFFYIYECEHVYMCFFPNVSRFSIPACPHTPDRVTMDHHPKVSTPSSWRTESNPSHHLFASTHSVPLFLTKSMLPSPGFTSTEVKKHLHTPIVASRLQSQPYGRLPVLSSLPLTPPHTLVHISVSIT